VEEVFGVNTCLRLYLWLQFDNPWHRLRSDQVLHHHTREPEEIHQRQQDCAKAGIGDPVLTYSMPDEVAIDTTLDAFSHLSEAYFSALCNPVVEAFAEKGFAYLKPT